MQNLCDDIVGRRCDVVTVKCDDMDFQDDDVVLVLAADTDDVAVLGNFLRLFCRVMVTFDVLVLLLASPGTLYVVLQKVSFYTPRYWVARCRKVSSQQLEISMIGF